MQARAAVEFTSYVAAAQREALEELVFFNAGQDRVWDDIVEAVERFGPPELVCEGDRLRVRLRDRDDVQSLFAVDVASGQPLGMAVYIRPDHEHITVLHVGIATTFASGGSRAGEQLLLRLLRELRRSSLRVKGVRHLELLYSSGRSYNQPRRLK